MALTVTLDRDVNGAVTVRNAGTGSTNVHTHGITGGRLEASGTGANNSLVVDGNVAMGTQIAFGGSVALVNFTGPARKRPPSTAPFPVTSMPPSLGFSTSSTGSLPYWEAPQRTALRRSMPMGQSRLRALAAPAFLGIVTGAVSQQQWHCLGHFNMHGAVSATSISDTISPVARHHRGANGLSSPADRRRRHHGHRQCRRQHRIRNHAVAVLSAPGPSSATSRIHVHRPRQWRRDRHVRRRGNRHLRDPRQRLLRGPPLAAAGADLVSKGTVTATPPTRRRSASTASSSTTPPTRPRCRCAPKAM